MFFKPAVCSETMKSEPRLFFCDNQSSSNQRPAHTFLQHYSSNREFHTGFTKNTDQQCISYFLPHLLIAANDEHVWEPEEVKVQNLRYSQGIIKELH